MNTGVDYFSPIHDKMPFQKPYRVFHSEMRKTKALDGHLKYTGCGISLRKVSVACKLSAATPPSFAGFCKFVANLKIMNHSISYCYVYTVQFEIHFRIGKEHLTYDPGIGLCRHFFYIVWK